VCDRQIDRYRIEYQVTDPRDRYGLSFHLPCYRAWQFECRCLLVHTRSSTARSTTRHRSSRPW
jgi:hypothetical protein